jgi:hypothetical protein
MTTRQIIGYVVRDRFGRLFSHLGTDGDPHFTDDIQRAHLFNNSELAASYARLYSNGFTVTETIVIVSGTDQQKG